ncbi:MAG TPA: outer membrane beta-barrel protein [Kofleriaceae bacterium]
MLLAATPVFAQDATPPAAPPPAAAAPAGGQVAGQKIVGVDVVGVLPLGDYSDASSFAIGAMARGEYVVNDKLTATLRIGYLYHLGTPDGESLYIIPIHVGATYTLAPKIFAWAELGLDIIGVSVDIGGVSGSTSDNKFGFAVGAGYEVAPKIKVRVGFYMPGSEDNADGSSTTLYGIIGSVGYDFAAF